MVDCNLKKLATNEGHYSNLQFEEKIKWFKPNEQTGWAQIIKELCETNPLTPLSSLIDTIPIVSKKELAETPFRLSGKLIYPSDFLPAQKVCAVEIDKKLRWCTQTKENQNNFSLFVPEGSYIVYSEVYGNIKSG